MTRRDSREPNLPPGPARDLVDLFRRLRHARRLTNGQVVIRTGLSRAHVSDVFNGRKPPGPETAEKIATALGASPKELVTTRSLAEQWLELNRYHRRQATDQPQPAGRNPGREIRIQLLGPVMVRHAGNPVQVPGATARALLAVLVLKGESGASTDDLITAVWDGPEVTRDSVYQVVRGLRHALRGLAPDVTLGATGRRYHLAVPDEAVDVRRFRRLAAEAHAMRRDDPHGAATLLAEALALWLGEPLSDVGDRLDPLRHQLRDERRVAVEHLASIEADRHSPQRVVDLLAGELASDPGWESAAALVVNAFTALGRREEATAVYRRARKRLAAAGLEPDKPLETAFRLALRGTDEPLAERPATPPGPTRFRALALAPSGLPRPDPHFTGRDGELERLLAALGRRSVCVVSGMAGVGKTSLATRAAREVAATFPDGVILIDLHGYTEGRRPLSAGEALDRLLRRDGIPGELIPPEPEERAALYAQHFADREMLLILDNAHDAVQVAPLLPTGPRCAAVVTSRVRLPALDDAEAVALDVLSAGEGAALFRAVVGADRLRDEPDPDGVVARIVDGCGRLPLAIRIAAGRHRLSSPRTLDDLARGLSDAHAALAELDDDHRGVAASLQVSFADLSPDLARTLVLTAGHPGTYLDPYAVAAMLGRHPDDAGRLLERLTDRYLLTPAAPGRYRFHDLILAFARRYPDEHDRAAALRSLVDYYLRAADLADRIITPHRYRVPLDILDASAALPPVRGYESALDWLDTEETNLAAVCLAAGAAGLDRSCWQLAYTLRGHYFLTKNWQSWLTTHQAALASARRDGDRRAQALIVNNLGLARLEQGHDATAARHYRTALRLFGEIGDAPGENTARANLAWLHYRRGRFAEFLGEMRPVLRFYQTTEAERNAAITQRGIGLAEAELGRIPHAVADLRAALAAFRRLDLRLDTAMTWNALGETHQRGASIADAVQAYEEAIRASERCGSAYERARAHHRLGQIDRERDALDGAREHFAVALADYRRLGAPQAADVEADLDALDG